MNFLLYEWQKKSIKFFVNGKIFNPPISHGLNQLYFCYTNNQLPGLFNCRCCGFTTVIPGDIYFFFRLQYRIVISRDKVRIFRNKESKTSLCILKIRLRLSMSLSFLSQSIIKFWISWICRYITNFSHFSGEITAHYSSKVEERIPYLTTDYLKVKKFMSLHLNLFLTTKLLNHIFSFKKKLLDLRTLYYMDENWN